MPNKITPPKGMDPFENPILAELRSRSYTETIGLIGVDEDESDIQFCGSWKGCRYVRSGAQELVDAVKACLSARGVQVKNTFISDQSQISQTVPTTVRRGEFSMLFEIDPTNTEIAKIREAICEVITASRRLQAEQNVASKAK